MRPLIGIRSLPSLRAPTQAGRVRHIKESRLRIERHLDVVARRSAEIANEVVIVRFESGQDLRPQGFALLALIVQHEMAAFVLHKLGFGRLLALRFIEKALHRGIGAKREGALPGHDGVLGVIGSELGIAEHGIRIGRIRIGPDCAFGIGQRLRGSFRYELTPRRNT